MYGKLFSRGVDYSLLEPNTDGKRNRPLALTRYPFYALPPLGHIIGRVYPLVRHLQEPDGFSELYSVSPYFHLGCHTLLHPPLSGYNSSDATTKLLHLSDTHLGNRQYRSDTRRDDFTRAFETAIDRALQENVDAVIHTGDLFHRRTPSLPIVTDCIEILRKLADEDIPLQVRGAHL
ncbi:metallophosphoesterase [Halobellus sp. ZY16]|uniref:metallophosphoesterase n=1 Tax=Halobellus ordinarius TaxID=3075120 RepID=UPI0028804126|nr:metallophosphoesterase [Halobellus sp. ZY16]